MFVTVGVRSTHTVYRYPSCLHAETEFIWASKAASSICLIGGSPAGRKVPCIFRANTALLPARYGHIEKFEWAGSPAGHSGIIYSVSKRIPTPSNQIIPAVNKPPKYSGSSGRGGWLYMHCFSLSADTRPLARSRMHLDPSTLMAGWAELLDRTVRDTTD